MAAMTGRHRFSWRNCQVIFSLLIVLTVLISPLLMALPVYADWGAEIRLTNAPGNSKSPSVAVSGNHVHVVWFDSRDGNEEIYYKRSVDGGTNWGAETRLTNAAGNSENPAIAVTGNVVHVAWFDERDGNPEIYYKRSTDGGITWGADTRLTNALGNSYTPSIAVSGSNVHVAWHDNRSGNEEIFYKRSADGGSTWGDDIRLTYASADAALSSIAVSGNNVHVAWQDQRDGNWEIYYKRSIDGGYTWGADTRLTNAAGDSRYPSIAVSGGDVHVAWQDGRSGNFQIYYKRSSDSGSTWGDESMIIRSPELSEFPSVAVSGNNVHVAWQDNRGEYYPRWDIFYKRSTDGGRTWGADTRLSRAPGNSEVPSIAVSGNNVHVTWQDMRDGNYEIYYEKYTGPAPAITSFGPSSGVGGTPVIITGRNFEGTTAVRFGGVPAASFSENSNTRITAIAGSGNSGKITVTTLSGTGTSAANFDFVSPVNPQGSSMSSAGPANPQSGPVPLAGISVRSASLSATKVTPGTPITVIADVVNAGTANGAGNIKVYVNGELENSQGVTVSSGASTPVTFTVSRNEPGTYEVYVGGTNAGSFTVDQFADPNSILYVSGALMVFAFVIGALLILRRRHAGR